MERYFSDIISITERDLIIEELDRLQELMYKNSEVANDSFYSNLSPTLSQVFLAWSRDNRSQSFDRDAILRTIRDFLDILNKLPIIEVKAAFQLNQQELKELQLKLGEYSNKFCLIDYIVDPTIIGGATFSFKGKYLDYSIASFVNSSYGPV